VSIKAVLFDGYGTLYQCPGLGIEVHKLIRAIVREKGKKGISLNTLRTGLSHNFNFLEIIADAEPQIKVEIQQYVDTMPQLVAQTLLYPNSLYILTYLNEKGYKTALVSDASNRSKPDLEKLGIESLLHAKVWSFETHSIKPDPQMFLCAAEKLEVKASECLVIGDGRHRDMQGARNAGMYGCLLDRSGAKKYDGYKIKSLLEVPQIMYHIDSSSSKSQI
jgi:HAD superfamily hydrolase (TIGR01509 family)